MKMIRRLISCAVLLFVLVTTVEVDANLVYAQSTATPTLQILAVDTTHFPEIAVTIRGAHLPAPLSALPATLAVDDTVLPVDADESRQQGIQLLLAVDVNRLVTRNDAGQSGFVALNGTLLDLVDVNALVRNQDWFAAYQLQGAAEPHQLQAWTQEPNQLLNSVITNRPSEITDAPLSADAIQALLAQLADLPDGVRRPKVLLLFSAGVTTADLGPAATAAQAAGVAVHVVELLSDASQTPNVALQNLAAASGGHYTALGSPEQSSEVTDALVAVHTVRTLQTRVKTATAQILRVTLSLPDEIEVEAVAAEPFAEIAFTPGEIRLIAPSTTVDWPTLAAAENHDARLLPVEVAVEWPNNQQRQLQQVTYTLRGPNGFAQQLIRTEAPFEQVTLTLENVADGDYTLAVHAIDELGLESTNATTAIRFSNVTTIGADGTTDPSAQPVQSRSDATSLGDENAVTVPAAPSSADVAPGDTVQLPGLSLAIPRALLLWSLPVLLLLIAYLIYSERRERRRAGDRPAQRNQKGQFTTAMGQDPRYDLGGDKAMAGADKRFALDGAKEPSTQRYTLQGEDGQSGGERVPLKDRHGHGTHGQPQPVMAPAFEQGAERYEPQPIVGQRAEEIASGWLDLHDSEEEATETPAYHEDDEATYRTQAVARSVLGHLVRTTSDPTLPQELPIYNVSTPSGTARQIYIGRHSQHNTIVINDKRVSREHAVIIQRNSQLYLRDNGSTAGTFLNWKRLNPGEELLLRHNDLIGFGQIAYEFHLGSEDEMTVVTG